MSGREIVLSLQNLRKSYGDLLAVDDLSLEVRRGEVFGFLGPNGAGKTTTIRMICGLLKPDAGRILIDGRSIQEDYRAAKFKIGLCPQELVIWESLTVLEQLVFIGQQYDLPRPAAEGRALELAEQLGLAEVRNRIAKKLSGGMQRRLNIALALVHDPEILILDEPQAGLDPQSRILVRDYIRSLARSTRGQGHSVTVILTSHDMDEVDRLADRVAIIDYGRLLVLDSPEKLKARVGRGDILEIRVGADHERELTALRQVLPENLQDLTYQAGLLRLAGFKDMDSIPLILEKIQATGIEIDDVTLRKTTLEDLFIDLTGRSLRP
jgi:ABC-2 type transport system ATP-binding protein